MSDVQEFRDDTPGQPPVRGFLHSPSHPSGDALVLTHGAGSNCSAPLLIAVATAFCDSGWTVLRCDLPFRQARPTGPPPRGSGERDQQGIRAAVVAMHAQIPSQDSAHIYLGGHSYGGRQDSMLAAAEPGLVDALLLLSYPLHPPQRPDQLRTAHFPNLKTPALFVLGARDGFASIDELISALKLIRARTELLPVPSAGHELLTKKNREALPDQIAAAFRSFISGVSS